MTEKKVFQTSDRDLRIELTLEENTLALVVYPLSGEQHFLQLTFTKSFARELRNFLNEAEPGESIFAPIG